MHPNTSQAEREKETEYKADENEAKQLSEDQKLANLLIAAVTDPKFFKQKLEKLPQEKVEKLTNVLIHGETIQENLYNTALDYFKFVSDHWSDKKVIKKLKQIIKSIHIYRNIVGTFPLLSKEIDRTKELLVIFFLKKKHPKTFPLYPRG